MKNIICLVLLLSVCVSCSQTRTQVSFEGRQLLVNQKPYLIKGVCYHPVPKGSHQRQFNNLDQDIQLMKEAGINTIRVYEPIKEKEVLDKFAEAGIKIIMGFGYNQNGSFDMYSGSFIDYVKKYKDHPAILFWELGNEYNYHPEWFEGDMNNWYKALEAAATEIHKVDTNHPVSTAHGELPKKIELDKCKSVDIWGMNVYRFDKPGTIFPQWEALSDKPMYLSEAGADSYMTTTAYGFEKGENEKAQAQANKNIVTAIFNHKDICSGVTLFQFTDGWWKTGNADTQDPGGWAPNSSGVPYDGSPNEEYWGIVKLDRNKKATFNIVKKLYQQN
ncbi:glycoside hydrolase family 2 TIM barrel-domain containing protein [Gaetbulibacter aestuarii]|uniref:Glycoside hydrolase family 2 TIM barrel-domain containing protein n=1 Tax=Gaetbulibacter aestuarii TaxID=1502358 RepID=A0ABW7N0T8_9FLAO